MSVASLAFCIKYTQNTQNRLFIVAVMNSFRVIFGQPFRDTGELFVGNKSALACDVVPLSYTRLSFRKKQFPELRQNTSSLPDFFFPAAER